MGLLRRSTFRLLAVALVGGALAVPMVLAAVAWGQGDEIRVLSQEVSGDFPNGITFKLTATSSDPIEEIRVFLKPLGSDQSTYAYLDIEPGRLVRGQYTMPIGMGTTHKPPGTVVRYSFEIQDSAGHVLRTEDQEYLYMDTSLDWKEISDEVGLLTVYYYGDFVERRARTVLETSQKTIEGMGPVLGMRPEDPIKIVAYSNYRDMARALPFRSQAVREELRTEGQAYPTERVLLVLISDATVTGIASHEFTHILVADAAGKGYNLIPAWLNEGLAEYGNIDKTPHYDWALSYAVFTRRLKPLWYMDTFGGQPEDILIGYGHGRSVVRYMIGQYGEERMAELMRAFQTSLSVDEALKRVYGFDQYGLDSEWRRSLNLAILPPPEELERQLAPAPGPTPSEGSEATRLPTPQVRSTPAPVEEATPGVAASSDDGRSTTRSCGGPSENASSLPLDVALLALLGGPLLAVHSRWGLRKRRLFQWLPMGRRLTKGSPRNLHGDDC